jgi:5-methylcytosine-specific restriction enzyme A
MIDLEPGQIYRRRELHDHFGGQRQGGISTPAKTPVVMIFTAPVGAHYGYRDHWTGEGRLRYFGEGQAGDMVMLRGNRSIRDHEQNDKQLLLFQSVARGEVRYLGEMRYVRHEWVDGTDIDGRSRRALVFELEPLDPQSTYRARSLPHETGG